MTSPFVKNLEHKSVWCTVFYTVNPTNISFSTSVSGMFWCLQENILMKAFWSCCCSQEKFIQDKWQDTWIATCMILHDFLSIEVSNILVFLGLSTWDPKIRAMQTSHAQYQLYHIAYMILHIFEIYNFKSGRRNDVLFWKRKNA